MSEEQGTKPGLGWKPIAAVAVVIMIAIAGIFLVREMGKVEIDPNEVNATLKIDYGNGIIEEYDISTVNNTLPGMLSASIGDAEFEVGRSIEGVAFIESVGSVENNVTVDGLSDTSSMWWAYSINGTFAPITSLAFEAKDDIAIIREGQIIELEFIVTDGPSGVFEDTGISITVNIDFGNGTYLNQTIITDNYTALGALEEAVGYDKLDMAVYDWGVLVNGIDEGSTGATIDGIDDTSNYYWFWYINDGYASVGASQYVLQDGDVMDWKFEESSW